MEEEGGSTMKYLVALSFLLLVGCGNPLTRLVPKIEMPAPPGELMKPPKTLKTLVPPVAPGAVTPETPAVPQ
jgi:hypothetical protein